MPSHRHSGEGIMSQPGGGLRNGIDNEKTPSSNEDDLAEICDKNVVGTRGVNCLTEPLIARANNDVDAAQLENDISSNEDCTMTIAQRGDDEDGNYVPLINQIHDEVPGSVDDSDDHQDQRYPLDPRRFAILAIFCLNNLIGSAVWITFAPIADAVKATFRQFDRTLHDGETYGNDLSNQQINWFCMVSMAVYAPGTALCAWSIPKHGFRQTVIASSLMMALGCFFRWLSLSLGFGETISNKYLSSNSRYFILLAGQGLVALGQTIFMNAPARIAASWFQQTTKTIAAIILCSNLGIVLGQALSPLCVVEETGEHLDQLLGAQGIAMGITAVFTACCFRYEEPASPPSAAEFVRRRERQRQHDRSSSSDLILSSNSLISKDIQSLLTNPQYIMLIVAFGINNGLNNAIMTLIQPWIASSGFIGDEVAGFCGSVLVGGGVIGTWIASVLLDLTRNFNQAIRWSFASTVVAAFGLVATLQPKCPTWILATTFTITGMTQMPLLTICSDAVAAHTYPVSEELSSAGLQMFASYLGIALVDGMSHLLDSTPNPGEDDGNKNEEKHGFEAEVNIAYLSLLGISAMIACFYKSDDLRANVELFQSSDSQTTTPFERINSHGNVSDNHNRSTNIDATGSIRSSPELPNLV